jgi:hypothetical protein
MTLDATVGGTASDTYGTLAEADAYFDSRDHLDHWTGADAKKEASLRVAAMYLDNVYRGRWKGLKVNRDQARAWPRSYAIDSDGYSIEADVIPVELKRAQFHAACLILNNTDLEAPLERAVKSEQVGDLSVTYMDGAASAVQYPEVTNWLRDLVDGPVGVNATVGSGKVIRA